MKIAFKDVGRGKNCWAAEIDTSKPDEDVWAQIARQILNHGGLISRGVDFDYDEGYNGSIYAGFHKVGTFAPAGGD